MNQVPTPMASFGQFDDDEFLNQVFNKDIDQRMFRNKVQSPPFGVRTGLEALSPPTTALLSQTSTHRPDRYGPSLRSDLTIPAQRKQKSEATTDIQEKYREVSEDRQSRISTSPAASPRDVGPFYHPSDDQRTKTRPTSSRTNESLQGQRERALNMAVLHGHVAMVNLLLNYGMDVNAQDGTGRTALHDAVESNDVKMVELLLQNGADQSYVDNTGMTALEISASVGSLEVAEVLLKAARMNQTT